MAGGFAAYNSRSSYHAFGRHFWTGEGNTGMDRGALFETRTLEMQNVLLSCIADAVEGAQQAYKAGILHRDLSAGNIMIVKDKETQEWRGILINWDMCMLWRKHGGEPRSGRTGTWAFISLRILQNEGPTVRHTLWDDIESAFWVLIYEALLYLKHDKHPCPLYNKMQAIFSYNSRLRDGSVVGGEGKMSVLAHCGHEESFWGLAQFENIGVNKLLDQLGKVLKERYRKDGKISTNLDDPDQTWFSESLREAAMKMEPLSVTPTGLKSPTNDSNPQYDLRTWESANPDDLKVDYFPMPLEGDPEKSTQVHMRRATSITDAMIHGLDGSSLGKHLPEHVDGSERAQVDIC
ncbi:hypothetical protein BYT27DRAFT_7191752 [Phlegmacium glaucopus]|nr:hypothetical protein BYT27DRAFT_7191752 [Phlegmacium glaucopus]